nr:arylesterase [uncultured Methylotenera sp.]
MLFRLLLVFKFLLKTVLLSLSFLHFVAWSSPVFAENAKIMVYGDSLSAAYGIPQQQGWASLLQKKLDTERYQYKVVNASVSGETTSGGVSRLQHTLAQTKPNIIILELGANDGLRGLPIQDMTANLNTIIEQSKKSGAKILLVGMRIPPNYGPQYTKRFSQSYVKLSQEHNVPLVPFMLENVAAKANLIQDDGLHPNAIAQPLVLDNIWPHLKQLLKK